MTAPDPMPIHPTASDAMRETLRRVIALAERAPLTPAERHEIAVAKEVAR